MSINWNPPIITSTIITCFLRGTLTNQTTTISIPLSNIKRTNFCTCCSLIFDLFINVYRFIVCASDHLVVPEQTRTKDKTFKQFSPDEHPKLLHWCCNWKGQVFTNLTLLEPPKFLSCPSNCKPRPSTTDFTSVEPFLLSCVQKFVSSLDLEPVQIPPINKIPLQKRKTTFFNERNCNNNWQV